MSEKIAAFLVIVVDIIVFLFLAVLGLIFLMPQVDGILLLIGLLCVMSANPVSNFISKKLKKYLI